MKPPSVCGDTIYRNRLATDKIPPKENPMLTRRDVLIGAIAAGATMHLRTGFAKASQPATPVNFEDRKSTRLNSSHSQISYAVFCLKKKKHIPPPMVIQAPLPRVTAEPPLSGHASFPEPVPLVAPHIPRLSVHTLRARLARPRIRLV